MKTVLQKDLYDRGKKEFDESELELFIFDVFEEDKMIETQQETGARCFIIGAEKYSNEFYNTIDKGSLIIRFGVGYDSVPLDICRKRDIKVAYTPRTLDESVAEHTVALILNCARQIPEADNLMKKNSWGMEAGLELKNKILAVIGFGNIGQQTARIAKKGFQMKIHALDIYPELDDKYYDLVDFYSTDFAEVVNDCDFISLNMAAIEETKNYIDRDKLILMPEKSFLINTARGHVINEEDLFQALNQREIAGAALDVYDNEPYKPVNENRDLRTLDNIILTPHIASNTDAANKNMTELSIKNAVNFYKNKFDEIEFIQEFK